MEELRSAECGFIYHDLTFPQSAIRDPNSEIKMILNTNSEIRNQGVISRLQLVIYRIQGVIYRLQWVIYRLQWVIYLSEGDHP